jgi:hypothetical protein
VAAGALSGRIALSASCEIDNARCIWLGGAISIAVLLMVMTRSLRRDHK